MNKTTPHFDVKIVKRKGWEGGSRWEFERGAERLDRLGTGRLRLRVGVCLDGRMSWSAWIHHPPPGPVLEWPVFLIWTIFFPLIVDVESWTAGGFLLRKGGEKGGVGGGGGV